MHDAGSCLNAYSYWTDETFHFLLDCILLS
jgi:hypothetical protein